MAHKIEIRLKSESDYSPGVAITGPWFPGKSRYYSCELDYTFYGKDGAVFACVPVCNLHYFLITEDTNDLS